VVGKEIPKNMFSTRRPLYIMHIALPMEVDGGSDVLQMSQRSL